MSAASSDCIRPFPPSPRSVRTALAAVLISLLPFGAAVAQESGGEKETPTPLPTIVAAPPAVVSIGAGSANAAAMQRGIGAIGRRDWDAASREFEAIVADDPDNVLALDYYGFALLMQARYEKAISVFGESLKRQPSNPTTLINLGNAHLTRPSANQQDYESAADAFEKAAALKPDSPDAQTGLGTAALRAGQYSKAEAAYRALLEIPTRKTADDGLTWTSLGFALQRQNKTDEAIAALQKGVELKQDQPGAWAMLGALYLQQSRHADALTALETARKLTPDSYSTLFNLGQVYTSQKRYSDAAEVYGAAVNVASEQGDTARKHRALYNQAGVLHLLGNDKAAADVYDTLIAEDPSDYDALLNSASALYTTGNVNKAVTRFNAAAALRPDAPQPWQALGKAYEQSGNRSKAAASWDKAASLTSDPTQKFSLYQYEANTLLALRRFSDLRAVAAKMQSLRPTSTTPPTLIGLTYQLESENEKSANRKQNLMLKGLRAFEAAVRNDPKNALAYNNMGVLRERRGEIPLALAAYKKALAADPNFAEARQNLGRYTKPAARKPRTGKIGQ